MTAPISRRHFRQKLRQWAKLGFTPSNGPDDPKTLRFRRLDNELPMLAYRYFVGVDPSLDAEVERHIKRRRRVKR